MARLLVRSAPGVREISSRLTTVSLVDDSVPARSGDVETWTSCLVAAKSSGKWSTGALPEVTVICWTHVAKPGATTSMLYSPTRTVLNSNSPSAFDCVARDQSEVRE